MHYIELTHQLKAIVDDNDYERMNQWNWHVLLSENKQKGKQNTPKIVRDVGDKTIEFGEELLDYDKTTNYLTFRNHNRLDFRRENLLLVPIELAQYHKASSTNSSSIYKGVHYDSSKKRYIAKIQVDGKSVHIGSSQSEEEAANLYNHYAKELFGEYAFQNIMGQDNRKPIFSTEENLQPRTSKQSTKKWRGVYKKENHFQANIKETTIGTFKTEEDAAYAYNKEAIRLYGKKAILNPLPDDFIGNPPVNEYELFGRIYKTIAEIANEYELPVTTLHNRLKKMSLEEAVQLEKPKPKLRLKGPSMRKIAEEHGVNRHRLSTLIKEGKTLEEALEQLLKKKSIK